jgi:asparagine N-glycosylation enzyme membrane subunit Stt3
MESESVSPDFTPDLMKRIMKKSKAKKEQGYFIFSVASIFVIIALGIIGYVISLIIAAPSATGDTVAGTKETVTILENLIVPIKNILSKTNIAMIGSIFSLGLLISVYFIFDLVKNAKGNLSRQH